VRDNRGRFASTPGGGAPKRPPAKRVSRGTNRLTRDNSGRITGVGGNGATARGGRLRTGAGNLRARQTMAVLSNGRMSSVPKGAIGRTRKQREITMIDRPISQRQAYNEGRAKQMAAIAARKAPKASAPGRIKAGRQKSTIRNTTGQSKTLNNFNSRPAGTMVLGPGYKLVPSPTRVPLRVVGPGAKDSDQAFARVATKAARSRAAWAKRKAEAGAAKKPIGWMQSPEARKDRTDPMMAGHRKDHGRRLKALPKAARRAIQIERLARKQKFLVAGNTAAQLSNLSEGRMQLIANVGKRKNKLTPGQIDAITRSMSQSARRLKVGMATGNRGRMKYNPKALQLAPSTAARKIRGARVGGVARKGKAAQPSRPSTGRRSAATSGLRPGKKIRGARLSSTLAKPRKPKAGSAGGKQLTQKERWAKRAELRRQQAAKAEARAKALYDKHRRQGDTAFWTQPGLHSQREKARAGLARSFAETEKAKRLLENARQLDKLAAANKGDTERRRQTQRDALSVNKGDKVYTAMYGTGRVVKINKKTITYYSESRGTTFNVDKSWVKPGADPYNR